MAASAYTTVVNTGSVVMAAEDFQKALQAVAAEAWRTGAAYGLERGVKAAFCHAYGYVNTHGPTESLGNLMLIEREIIQNVKKEFPLDDDILVTVDNDHPVQTWS